MSRRFHLIERSHGTTNGLTSDSISDSLSSNTTLNGVAAFHANVYQHLVGRLARTLALHPPISDPDRSRSRCRLLALFPRLFYFHDIYERFTRKKFHLRWILWESTDKYLTRKEGKTYGRSFRP